MSYHDNKPESEQEYAARYARDQQEVTLLNGSKGVLTSGRKESMVSRPPEGVAGIGRSALDKQEGGNHYKHWPIQPIEFISKNHLPFTVGNVIKYVVRAADKNGIEDLRKANHYLELEAELRYGEKL